MTKTFNSNGTCFPDEHYMVDLESRLAQIRTMVERKKYFVINRGRQYGKTTILRALGEYLQQEYVVLSMDFQNVGAANFENEHLFAQAFAYSISKVVKHKKLKIANLDSESIAALEKMAETDSKKKETLNLQRLFGCLSRLCDTTQKPIVLMIDEVDSASNYPVFLDFLAQLRAMYLSRKDCPSFQSVILAGVYDIKNLKQKIRPKGEHQYNNPWNIAADFDIEMAFYARDIAGMLEKYEQDYHTGMDIGQIANLIYDYTNGYPYLVSRICQLIDERVVGSENFPDKRCAWTKAGIVEAVNLLFSIGSSLFDDMVKKLSDFSELKNMLKEILFHGRTYSYERENPFINLGIMFGFLKNQNHSVMIANRIFETKLYNLFLSEEETGDLEYRPQAFDKNQFVQSGRLNMELVMKKFAEHYEAVYGNCTERFLEENGRRLFLLYLRPIINGTGNYYIEAQTRDMKRTDIIVDYCGEQFIIELKIWRGNEYQMRGKQQLFEYLQYFHKDKGYLLSYNFNKKKQTGIRKILFQGKEIVEAII